MPGYAPAYAGPFTTPDRPGKWDRIHGGYAASFLNPSAPASQRPLNGIPFILSRGISPEVHVVDGRGRPIPGARITGQYPGPPALDLPESTTDASGIATLQHIGVAPLNLSVSADGYQAGEVDGIQLDPAKPYFWKLKEAPILHGIVTTPAGAPIAGALIKLAGVSGPLPKLYSDPSTAPVLTTTDPQGRFALGSLRRDSRYFLYVEAPGCAGELLGDVQPSSPALKVSLGPEMVVRGRLIHAIPLPPQTDGDG
jgi:hypothetical protein